MNLGVRNKEYCLLSKIVAQEQLCLQLKYPLYTNMGYGTGVNSASGGKLGHTAECTVYNIDMPNENIDVLSEITDIEIIAIGNSIRNLDRLQKKHGRGRWRKLKGFANVRLPDNTTCFAEIHWYEAHGIGKRDIKVKRILGK